MDGLLVGIVVAIIKAQFGKKKTLYGSMIRLNGTIRSIECTNIVPYKPKVMGEETRRQYVLMLV